MADCIECGHVADELGYKCNHCGREVCWDHRRPGDHDCRPDADPATGGSTPGTPSPPTGGSVERGATAVADAGPVAGEGPAASVVDDSGTVVADPVADGPSFGGDGPSFETDDSYFEADGRAYPWWVYVLVVLLFVFPSLVAGLFAVL